MARAPYVSFSVRPSGVDRRASAREIVGSLVDEIGSGRIAPGCRLPPVRTLEQQLGLSKNTAQAAYDELVARGLLEAREREGFFVAPTAERTPGAAPIATPPALRLRPMPSLSPRAGSKDAISLSTVFVDPTLLPTERLADCVRSVLKAPGLDPFYDFQGYPPLREAIAARLRARGMDVSAANVVVTTGSQQAIDLISRALEVRSVATEDPVYAHAKYLFESQGNAVHGLTLDPFRGIDLDRWESQLAAARPGMLYAITSFQNPTGYCYSSHELVALVRLAEKYGFALVEDDWGSDMLSGSEYRPTLRALGGSNVVYINSFTKKLMPSLRLGFLVADDALIPSLISAKRISTLGNAWLLEAALAEFLDRGYYDTHLAALQRELDARYEQCLAALHELMPDGVRWTTPGGGPTLWLDLPRSVDLAALQSTLGKRGVVVETTASAFHGAPHLHGFRVSYAFSPPDRLRTGLAAVSEEVRRALRG